MLINRALKWFLRITLLLALVASNGPVSFTGFHYTSLVRTEVVQAKTSRRRSVANFKHGYDCIARSILQAINVAKHFFASILLYDIAATIQLHNNRERFTTTTPLSGLFHPCYSSNHNSDEPFARGISRG